MTTRKQKLDALREVDIEKEEAEALIALSRQEATRQFNDEYNEEHFGTGGILGIIPEEFHTNTTVVGDITPTWGRGRVNSRTAAHRVKVCSGSIINAEKAIRYSLPVDELIEVDPIIAEHLGEKFIRQ